MKNTRQESIPRSGVLLIMAEEKAVAQAEEMVPSQRLKNRLRTVAGTSNVVLLPVDNNGDRTFPSSPAVPLRRFWRQSVVRLLVLLGILLLVVLALKAEPQSTRMLQEQIDDLTRAQIAQGTVLSTETQRTTDVERRVDNLEKTNVDVRLAQIETREETNRWLLYAIATGILGLIAEAASRALVVLAKGKSA